MSDRCDYLLLALAKSPDGSLAPVQAQKAMFLLYKETQEHVGSEFYKFVPYNYGPFSSDIYNDISKLEKEGFVIVDRSKRYPEYTITKKGVDAAGRASNKIDKTVDAYLTSVVGWTKSQSFSSLLQAIYKKYPDYAVNSVFNK